MERIPVIYQGENYLLLHQYACGYCEIIEDGESNYKVKLVHFSELKLNLIA
ncbi:hypothetical protein [Neobacillus bataviensis]|uniref:hypothetical protein n=1 Tax=Neobacillus bataviensis TaxID=220685 RepID=UPI001CBCEE01|nr:hypothetical protein [Neobacillus bataviensis]